MSLGRREVERQAELWVSTAALPRTAGHPFYEKLNQLLSEAGFDRFVEGLCAAHYAKVGRPSIPPGVYFRMLFVGYFEGLDSQRGIAWRCSDSLALKTFLGYGLTDSTPEHSSLTYIRQRLPEVIYEQVFTFVLQIAHDKKLLKGRTAGIDATLPEANAAMKSIVRKDTGDDWKAWLRKLAAEAGIDDPSDDDLKKFDQGRKDKKVGNAAWESKTDGDARIMKMKDGRTHLAYKAEHAVDLESGLLLAATIHAGDAVDGDTLRETLIAAQANLIQAGSDAEIKELPADNGYHKNETLGKLHDHLRRLPAGGVYSLRVPAAEGWREAEIALAWAAVTIRPPRQPRGRHGPEPLALYGVIAREVLAAPDQKQNQQQKKQGEKKKSEEPIEWILLTNQPIAALAAAKEAVEDYACRWMIEDYHKALKTGCGIEQTQMTTLHGLRNVIALTSVLAVHVLRLRCKARDEQIAQQPARLHEEELKVQLAARDSQHANWRTMTVWEFFIAVARMGGYVLNPKNARPAG